MHPAIMNINTITAPTYITNVEVNSHRPNLVTYRTIFNYSVCLLTFGLFLLITGSIVTACAYVPPFSDHLQYVGPTLLAFGALFTITSIIIFCIAKYRMKKGSTGRNFAPSAPPLPLPPVYFRPQMLENHASRNPSYVLPIEHRGTLDDQPPCYRCVMQNSQPSKCRHYNYDNKYDVIKTSKLLEII
ncbi:uncharacterized protein LOC111613663 isoform X2 [Centruroides sculpturatus]|uniref:uncharacterized protein LOC111613663 isoform X2 n=1 Tax=Centruroides sculpturatus TaxID=218467 RepID=UPI000C6E86D1|nr:uncharacterized protein LOC111613663 isoform X2 [Centruroides sculpturatus]